MSHVSPSMHPCKSPVPPLDSPTALPSLKLLPLTPSPPPPKPTLTHTHTHHIKTYIPVHLPPSLGTPSSATAVSNNGGPVSAVASGTDVSTLNTGRLSSSIRKERMVRGGRGRL